MKNYAAIVAVCVLAGAGDAGEFLFLTPSDNGGRTISEEAVDQYDFAGKAPLITAYAPKVPVQPVLLEAMKRLGTELFANIAFDPLDTPDCFRVRAGFGAAVPGIWDGVFLTGCGRLEAPYARALAEAKQDAALVMRLRDLANQLRNKEDLILVAEGRRALKWIRNQRPTSTDPDLLRLEIGAWLRRLEAVLGLAHAPDPSPAGKIAAKAAPPDGSLPAVGLKMPAPGVPLDAAGKIRFACDWRGFTITVADPGDTCTLALDLSAADPDARLRYDMTLDIDKPPKPSPPGYPERASFPASGEMNYIQHRFGRFKFLLAHGFPA